MENHVLQSMGEKCSLPTTLNPGREKRKSLKSPKTKKREPHPVSTGTLGLLCFRNRENFQHQSQIQEPFGKGPEYSGLKESLRLTQEKAVMLKMLRQNHYPLNRFATRSRAVSTALNQTFTALVYGQSRRNTEASGDEGKQQDHTEVAILNSTWTGNTWHLIGLNSSQ